MKGSPSNNIIYPFDYDKWHVPLVMIITIARHVIKHVLIVKRLVSLVFTSIYKKILHSTSSAPALAPAYSVGF